MENDENTKIQHEDAVPKTSLPDTVATDETKQPRKISILHNKKVLIAVGVVFVLSIFTVLGIIVVKKSSVDKTVIVPSPTITTQRPQYKSKILVLKRKTPEGEEVLYTFGESGDRRIIRWNDYLIYGNNGYGKQVELFSHNLKTGETKTLYQEDTTRRYISDLQVINNTLFFSVGGYLAGGASYWLNLPPSGKPQQLAENANGRIEFMKDKYWIIGGEGDACWGTSSYSLLNLNTKKVTHVADSVSGCFEGEEYVDIDKRDKMIMAFHTGGTGDSSESGDGVYQYVIAIPLTNPSVKEGVIAKQDMPDGVTVVRYSEDTDRLLLFGKSLHTFDFMSGKLNKIADIPETWKNGAVDSWKGDVVCLSKRDSGNVAGISLTSGQLNENSSSCQKSPSPTPKPYQEVQQDETKKFIESLNLPSNYEFVVEEQ